MIKRLMQSGLAAYAIGAGAICEPWPALAAWEPSQPIELIVPDRPGSGADYMARLIATLVSSYALSPQPIAVVNKSGSAGGEGFLDMKQASGNPHKMIIALSNLFTTPLGSGVSFNWRDLTPVAMLALDEFILWVPAETPYKTAEDYIRAVIAAPGTMKMGGTGSQLEDQILTVAIERATAATFTYVPYRSGGEVAVQLGAGRVNSSVNNPIEAVALWREGRVRPLCVFDAQALPYRDKIADGIAWSDIPTCRSQGINVEFRMQRSIFIGPRAAPDQVAFYVDLMRKVRETPEWKSLMRDVAFSPTFMTGVEFSNWLEAEEKRHHYLMRDAGFLSRFAPVRQSVSPVVRAPDASPAVRASDADVIREFGLLGRIAVSDCSAPTSEKNPNAIFAISATGRVTRTMKRPPREDVTTELRNLRMIGPNMLQYDETGATSDLTTDLLREGTNRFRSWRMVRTSGANEGEMLTWDGKYKGSHLAPTPVLARCD